MSIGHEIEEEWSERGKQSENEIEETKRKMPLRYRPLFMQTQHRTTGLRLVQFYHLVTRKRHRPSQVMTNTISYPHTHASSISSRKGSTEPPSLFFACLPREGDEGSRAEREGDKRKEIKKER